MFVYSREPLGLTVGDTQGPQCKLKSVSGQQSLYWAKVLLVLSPHEAEEEGSQDLSVPRGFSWIGSVAGKAVVELGPWLLIVSGWELISQRQCVHYIDRTESSIWLNLIWTQRFELDADMTTFLGQGNMHDHVGSCKRWLKFNLKQGRKGCRWLDSLCS